jgi:ribosomal protein L10
MDATADANNSDALGRFIDERQSTVASQKLVTEAIQNALADANEDDPSTTAARKLQDRAKAWKAQQHTKLDLDAVRLESIADELETVSSRNVNKRDALKQIVNREEARMSVLSVHAALVKTGGPQ